MVAEPFADLEMPDGSTRADSGKVFIIRGTPQWEETLDLSNAASYPQVSAVYGGEEDLLGLGAVRAGDVNGDGISDIVLAAEYADFVEKDLQDAGAVFVIEGRANAFPSVFDMAKAPGSAVDAPSLRLYGGSNYYEKLTSYGALALADMNGDGIQDILAGSSEGILSPGNDNTSIGHAYIVFGKKTWSNRTIECGIKGAPLGPEVTLVGGPNDSLTSMRGMEVGDLNGDGTKDLILGALYADGPSESRESSGEAYVLLGTAVAPEINLADDLGNNIPHQSVYDFGAVTLGSSVTRTIT
ncbi:MAG: hypothetical protein ACOYMN_08200, partial [Roseimicrobium sp.]